MRPRPCVNGRAREAILKGCVPFAGGDRTGLAGWGGRIRNLAFRMIVIRTRGCRSRASASVEPFGPSAKLRVRNAESGDCPKRNAVQLHERCDLICPDLRKVL